MGHYLYQIIGHVGLGVNVDALFYALYLGSCQKVVIVISYSIRKDNTSLLIAI